MTEQQGMELRDWFAGQALNGLLAGPNAPKKSGAESPQQYAVRVAEEAYLFADALLAARVRETEPEEGAGAGANP
jgi:hypothetical protein